MASFAPANEQRAGLDCSFLCCEPCHQSCESITAEPEHPEPEAVSDWWGRHEWEPRECHDVREQCDGLSGCASGRFYPLSPAVLREDLEGPREPYEPPQAQHGQLSGADVSRLDDSAMAVIVSPVAEGYAGHASGSAALKQGAPSRAVWSTPGTSTPVLLLITGRVLVGMQCSNAVFAWRTNVFLRDSGARSLTARLTSPRSSVKAGSLAIAPWWEPGDTDPGGHPARSWTVTMLGGPATRSLRPPRPATQLQGGTPQQPGFWNC